MFIEIVMIRNRRLLQIQTNETFFLFFSLLALGNLKLNQT